MAVLIRRSQILTPLEMLMSFWALGYMLDEVWFPPLSLFNSISGGWFFQRRKHPVYSQLVEFVWCTLPLANSLTRQIGILSLFVAFLGLRVYGFVAGDPTFAIADTAYDLLAANAIFLFPRLFAALGTYSVMKPHSRGRPYSILFPNDYRFSANGYRFTCITPIYCCIFHWVLCCILGDFRYYTWKRTLIWLF
jgi:hypothetical protein